MAESGSSDEANEKRMTLKRKRSPSHDDEVENMPPVKISPNLDEELAEQPVEPVVVESSCSSEDESLQLENIDQPSSVFTDVEYNADSFLSPPSIPELPNCVLSPLENVSTPHSNKRSSTSKLLEPLSKRKCPLPGLTWADPTDVWKSMCECDTRSCMKKDPKMFDHHSNVHLRMRAILLDWLNEVCEVYKLRRETFYLTADYIDRYLTSMEDVPKSRLQLMGITCLFIAAKVEEVYPPKIGEYAYVTDGACSTEEILLEELLILKVLGWSLTPITMVSWLNVYMQLASDGASSRRRLIRECEVSASAMRGYTFAFPQYSSLQFVECVQLLDLAMLHVQVNRFSCSEVAAAAFAHASTRELAVRVSGFSYECLEPCYRWLEPFVRVLREDGPPAARALRHADADFVQSAADLRALCPDLNQDESHSIQTHNVTLDMFDKVVKLMESGDQSQEGAKSVPEHVFPPTPPSSDQKSPNSPSTKTPSTRPQPHDTRQAD